MITTWQNRWKTLLSKIQLVNSEYELEQMLVALTKPKDCQVLAFVNAHAMNVTAEIEGFYNALVGSDIVLRDGSGMSMLFRLNGMQAGFNLNGTDLIPKIIQRFNEQTIAFYGTCEPFLSKASSSAANTLADKSAFYTCDGFQEPSTYIDLAKLQRPSLIVLGMGMPKQELIAHQLRANLDFPCLIVCGGAIIDFLGGKVQRSPKIFRIVGVEWLYRLLLEPRRLFGRYVIGNPKFIWRALHLTDIYKHK